MQIPCWLVLKWRYCALTKITVQRLWNWTVQTLAQVVIWPEGEIVQHILRQVSQNNKHFMYNMYNIYYNI